MLSQDALYTLQLNILSTLVRHPEKVSETDACLSPEDFCLGTECRAIYEVIIGLVREGAPLAAVSLRSRLGEALSEFFNRELDCPINPDTLGWARDTLRENARMYAMHIEALHLSMTESPEDARACLERLNQLTVTQNRTDIVSAADAAMRFYDRQDLPAPEYLRWGIPALDRALYIQPGDFVVVGGYPSAGKTLLSLQFALEQARTWSVGYFSLETGTDKLTDRLLCHLAQVELAHIKTRNLSDDDWKAIGDASVELSRRKLELIDAGGMSVGDIRGQTMARHYQVVMVDYLQLLKPDSGHSRYEQVTAISLGLHTLARQCNCAVVALAQLSRPERINGKLAMPGMNSFRESGQIEQDADAAMLLFAEDPDNVRAVRILKLAKNKEGRRCRVELEFDGPHQTLRPLPPEPAQFRELKGNDPNVPF